MTYYILDDANEVVPVDVSTWAEWFETAGEHRIVNKTEVYPGVRVSTVFMGIDHLYGNDGSEAPLLFESMIFVDGDGRDEMRCRIWSEAEWQHEKMCEKAKQLYWERGA